MESISLENSSGSVSTVLRKPKNLITYVAQIGIIIGIIITSLVQIAFQAPDKELWLVLLSTALGYILPTPGLKFSKSEK